MPDDTAAATVPPAMSADEWEFYGDEGDPFGERAASRGEGYHDGLYSLASPGLTPAKAHKLVALANHVLPAGHHGRLAREDVDNLRRVLEDYEREFMGIFDARAELARATIAKLAALLPPEGARHA